MATPMQWHQNDTSFMDEYKRLIQAYDEQIIIIYRESQKQTDHTTTDKSLAIQDKYKEQRIYFVTKYEQLCKKYNPGLYPEEDAHPGQECTSCTL
jgi:hypothetical protein